MTTAFTSLSQDERGVVLDLRATHTTIFDKLSLGTCAKVALKLQKCRAAAAVVRCANQRNSGLVLVAHTVLKSCRDVGKDLMDREFLVVRRSSSRNDVEVLVAARGTNMSANLKSPVCVAHYKITEHTGRLRRSARSCACD